MALSPNQPSRYPALTPTKFCRLPCPQSHVHYEDSPQETSFAVSFQMSNNVHAQLVTAIV